MNGGVWTFTGRGRLLDRPMGIFEELFRAHGARYEQTPEEITVRGPLPVGIYELPGNVSSQFVSGLLLALPLAAKAAIPGMTPKPQMSSPRESTNYVDLTLDPQMPSPRDGIAVGARSEQNAGDLQKSYSEIRLTSPLESANYVDLTLEAMRAYGIAVQVIEDEAGVVIGWRIPAGQQYAAPGAGEEHVCGVDWSQATFFLCAGALGCDVAVAGLDAGSVQGDRRVLTILESMGARVAWRASLVQAYPAEDSVGRRASLRGVVIDARDIPDIVPPLAALACYAAGETRFVNAGRLRIKESDRLAALAEELGKLGADIRETPDGLVIQGTGGGKLPGGAVQAHGDHRIAMALAVAAIGCEKTVEIEGAECVAKSYPGFWADFSKV
jgi:3-phosphoshikimate 1-carboxyvinyltransferase